MKNIRKLDDLLLIKNMKEKYKMGR